MTTFNIHEAKTQFSRLVERALAGEEIVIAKAGKPLVRLAVVEERRRREPGLAKGRLTDAFFEPLPEDELRAWER